MDLDQLDPTYYDKRKKPKFLTHAEWLNKNYPDEDPETFTYEPPVPKLTDKFRKYRNFTPEKRKELIAKYPGHTIGKIEKGEFPIYGTLGDEFDLEQAIHGPLEFNDLYPDSTDFGLEGPFEADDRNKEIMASFGYELGNCIARGPPQLVYDHQVWKVSAVREYAAKIVSTRLHLDRPGGKDETATQLIDRVEQESNIMSRLNHPNIIKIIETFGIMDKVTQFSHAYTIMVMELMTGSVQDLPELYKANKIFNPKLIPDVVVGVLTQMIMAVDYLHNDVLDYVIVHQAIRPANILYRFDPKHPSSQYKLADFEECFEYEKSGIQENEVFDILKSVRPYKHHCSSPEYQEAFDNPELCDELRTMPNDIYCVAASVCALINRFVGEHRHTPQMIQWLHQGNNYPLPIPEFYDILRSMTDLDPEQRPTARQLKEQLYS